MVNFANKEKDFSVSVPDTAFPLRSQMKCSDELPSVSRYGTLRPAL